MSLERRFGLLINAGEEAEIAKVLKDDKGKLHLAQSLKGRKCSFWTEG